MSVGSSSVVDVADDAEQSEQVTVVVVVVGVCGLTSAGKDTIADFLTTDYKFQRASFASILKDVVARVFSFDRDLLEGRTDESRAWREQPDAYWSEKLGQPGLSPRRILQLWGTEVVRNGFHQDMWVLALERDILSGKYGPRVVITDCRFENEIKMIHKLGGRVWRVQRGAQPSWEAELRRYASTNDPTDPTATTAAVGQSPSSSSLAAHIASIKDLPHVSEWASVGLEDVLIDNNGTLEALREQVAARITAGTFLYGPASACKDTLIDI